MKRIILAALLCAPFSTLADVGQAACVRAVDAAENIVNRDLTSQQETVAIDAGNHALGGAANATNAVKCTNFLAYLHNAVKQAVIAKKNADAPPANSSEVD